jgi:hypothetical protein
MWKLGDLDVAVPAMPFVPFQQLLGPQLKRQIVLARAQESHKEPLLLHRVLGGQLDSGEVSLANAAFPADIAANGGRQAPEANGHSPVLIRAQAFGADGHLDGDSLVDENVRIDVHVHED